MMKKFSSLKAYFEVELSTREWIALIVICLLLELIFMHVVYTWGGSKLALDHISFAGTLVSIVLAVVAIIYGFIQSFTQQSTIEKVSGASDQLHEVVTDVTSSTRKQNEINQTIIESVASLVTGVSRLEQVMGDVKRHVSESGERITGILSQIGGFSKTSESAPHSFNMTELMKSNELFATAAILAARLNGQSIGEIAIVYQKLWSIDPNLPKKVKDIFEPNSIGVIVGILAAANAFGLYSFPEPATGIFSDDEVKEIREAATIEGLHAVPDPKYIDAAIDEAAEK